MNGIGFGRGHRQRLARRMSNFAPCRGQATWWSSQRPFTERAAVVRADVVDAVELARHMKQHDDAFSDFEGESARIGNTRHGCHFHKVAHGSSRLSRQSPLRG